MATLTAQEVTEDGSSITFSSADGAGDEFKNTGEEYLHVKNGSASSMDVTVKAQRQCNHGFTHDVTSSVAASGEKIFGPFKEGRFNDDNGKVQITYSDATSVTVAVTR